MEDKRTIGRTERLSTEDKQYLKEMCFKKHSKDLTQDLRDLSPHQKWAQWKGDCQEAIVNKWKQEEKAKVCQITQIKSTWYQQ